VKPDGIFLLIFFVEIEDESGDFLEFITIG
jgi:hypothetical protein